MNPIVRATLEDICAKRWSGRGRVLEIGAVAGSECLLMSPVFARADERTGINLAVSYEGAGFRIVECNANDMSMFDDDHFDLVVSNAVLEHDPMFWLTLGEIKRVAKPGALILVGVPGYADIGWLLRTQRFVRRLPIVGRRRKSSWLDGALTSTITYRVHDHPGDYYRFSEQAMAKVLLRGCADVETTSILVPPRVIGSGYLRASSEAV